MVADLHTGLAAPADILTAVIRLPGDAGARLRDALAPVRRAHPQHYYYPLESLHLTVHSFRGLTTSSAAYQVGLARLRALVTSSRPPTVSLGGLAVTGETVMAWARVEGVRFERYAEPRTMPPHVSLVRLATDEDPAVARALSRVDADDLGSFTPSEVVVVRCDAVMAPATLEVLERLPFREAPHGR